LFFLVIIAVPIILIMLQRRTMRRQQDATQQHLAPGVEVMTGGGLYGYVHAVRDDVVELETSPGVITRWDRRAIARVLIPEDAVDADSTDLSSEGGNEPDDGLNGSR
jgi:preprotein translocase subunit YajC